MRGGVAPPVPPHRRYGLSPGLLWLAWAGLLYLLTATGASAQSLDDERARTHFVAGDSYYEQGRYREATREFDEAYQLSGRPEMLINRARAEERAGEAARAIASLELLLDRHPQTSYREQAEAELVRLRALAPEPAPAAPAPQAAPAAGDTAVSALEASAPLPRRRLWPPRLPTLIVGGTLLASVLVSVGTGWAAHAKEGELERDCDADGGCPPGYEQDQERGLRLARTSTGFMFASIALGAATGVLWFYDVKASKAGVALGMRPNLGGGSAQLRWSY